MINQEFKYKLPKHLLYAFLILMGITLLIALVVYLLPHTEHVTYYNNRVSHFSSLELVKTMLFFGTVFFLAFIVKVYKIVRFNLNPNKIQLKEDFFVFPKGKNQKLEIHYSHIKEAIQNFHIKYGGLRITPTAFDFDAFTIYSAGFTSREDYLIFEKTIFEKVAQAKKETEAKEKKDFIQSILNKRNALFMAALLFSQFSFGQDVLQLFQQLPDSVVMNLNTKEREEIIQISKDNKNWNDAVKDLNTKKTSFVFEKVNTKKNYLELIGNFEGKWQMKAWKISGTYFLISVYKESCGPICNTEQLDFYGYLKSKGFIKLKLTTVFPENKIQKYIAAQLLPSDSLEQDFSLDYLLFRFSENDKISVLWNEFMAEKHQLELDFQLNLLPDNLKNETYFGIKEN